jgi:hypothetical protein
MCLYRSQHYSPETQRAVTEVRMYNPRHQPKASADICHITVGDGDPACRRVVGEGRPRAYQPVSGKNDVRVNHGDQAATGCRDSSAPGVAPAAVLFQHNESHSGVLPGNSRNDLCGTVARTVVDDDDLMFTEILMLANSGKGIRNICGFMEGYAKPRCPDRPPFA